jgi:copper transport protein
VIAAIALTLSGVALSGRVITSLTALFATTYGRVLLIKIVVVVVAFAVGAAGRLRRFESGWRPRLVAEAFLGAALVLSGSVLSVSEPALGAQYSPLEAKQVRPPVSEQPNDLVLRISLDPGRPGPNAVSVEVLNTRRPVPAKTSGVEAVITPVGAKPIVLSATVPSDGNRYDLGSALLTSPGDATVTATVRRPGFPDTVVSAPFAIEPLPIPRHDTIISSRELRPWTDLLAVIALALAGVVIGARVSRRRREPDSTPAHTATGEGPADPVTEVRHPQSALR